LSRRSFGDLHPIAKLSHALPFGAVVAAKERAVLFQPMTDNSDAAGCAVGSERVNGAFEAVVCVPLSFHNDLKCLVVIIAAGFADWHGATSGLVFSESN
jgi:molybdopterin biosynthesis enzyme